MEMIIALFQSFQCTLLDFTAMSKRIGPLSVQTLVFFSLPVILLRYSDSPIENCTTKKLWGLPLGRIPPTSISHILLSTGEYLGTGSSGHERGCHMQPLLQTGSQASSLWVCRWGAPVHSEEKLRINVSGRARIWTLISLRQSLCSFLHNTVRVS